MTAQVVTLTGDRQAGKTHAAMAVAALDAIQGRDVVYETWNRDYADHLMRVMAKEVMPTALIERAIYTKGDQQIRTITGGRIRFRSPRQRALAINDRVQTYIVDDYDPAHPLPPAAANAEHVYVLPLADANVLQEAL